MKFVTPVVVKLAFDKSPANRYKDEDGRLHVRVTNISKATVNPYRGKEIPDFDKLGLDPDRVYQMLRDPEELEKAAHTFRNLPLLNVHVPHTAENHDSDTVVGSTGSDVAFNDPYLQSSLVIWEPTSIEGVESEKIKELSSAYRYDADMKSGKFKGKAYDGVMRNLRGNHVAIVPEGRAGPDVVVADAALKPSGKFAGGLTSYRKFAPGKIGGE